MRPLRVLHWHVHGSWSTAFVQGGHDYLLPTWIERDHTGTARVHGGRPRAWDWPASVMEVPQDQLARYDIDVVVLQRPEEIELVRRCTGRRPGRDLPAIYVEHNTPRGDVPLTRHPLADHDNVPLVHVTDFNELMWDSGQAPTTVVRHGILDPGYRYTGELARAAVVINEPLRRGRVTGTDLLPRFAETVPLDLFGMGLGGRPGLDGPQPRLTAALGVPSDALTEVGDLPQSALHSELARRRVYLHTTRWTSLGLSLIEAMALGMPVVALATTEVVAALPPDAGVLATRLDTLMTALDALVADPAQAREMGRRARRAALRDFGLDEFVRRWDELLTEVSG